MRIRKNCFVLPAGKLINYHFKSSKHEMGKKRLAAKEKVLKARFNISKYQ